MEDLRRCLKINAGDDIVAQRDYLNSLFRRWDTFGQGLVSKNVFKQAIAPLRTRTRDSDIDEWFQQFGAPGQRIDLRAFSNALCRRGVTSNTTSLGVPVSGALTAEQKLALVKEFRTAVARRGGLNGMASLGRAFRIYDNNGDNFLTQDEFMQGMQNFGLNVSVVTAKELMSCFDLNADGKLNFTEFLRGVRGGMNAFRKNLVLQAFGVLDRDGSGEVRTNDLAGAYNAKAHPYVIDGRMTEEQVLQDFMSQWDGKDQNGIVTAVEFTEYYENVSSSIDRDDYFELMIRNAWHMMGGQGASENTSNARVLVTYPDGSQKVVGINNDLGLDLQDVNEVNRRLRNQGEQGVYAGGGNNGPRQDKKSTQGGTNYIPPYVPSGANSPQRKNQTRRPVGAASSGTGAPAKGVPGAFSNSVLKEFRKLVVAHGGSNGIRSLGSIFRRMDDNGNRKLSAEELQSGMADYGVRMSMQDCQVLLTSMDRTGSGSLLFDDFLLAMRGEMNAFRQGFVEKAFAIMDKDGSGIIDLGDVKSSYDTSRHPDVLQGRKTADQVYSEFMSMWETEGSVDGKVTQEEFIAYYQDVSASIDDDQYFELMMRNAWHMTGGSGWSENTSNLRVLVIFTDGSQQVVEVKNDLGLSRNDAQGIRTALRRQGVTNIAKVRMS